MFSKARRNALLKIIAPLAEAARKERIAKEARYNEIRAFYLSKGVTGVALKRSIEKQLKSGEFHRDNFAPPQTKKAEVKGFDSRAAVKRFDGPAPKKTKPSKR